MNDTPSNLILVCGSRDWRNGRRIFERLSQEPAGTTVIEGGQVSIADFYEYGADRFARYAARLLGFRVITVAADWKKHGRAAGPIRNRKMLDMKPVKVIAFHDDLNASRGTRDCLNEAISRGIAIDLIDSEV